MIREKESLNLEIEMDNYKYLSHFWNLTFLIPYLHTINLFRLAYKNREREREKIGEEVERRKTKNTYISLYISIYPSLTKQKTDTNLET